MKGGEAIPVVILCGGRGVRLGEVTNERPKPLVPIGGMPILWHIMKTYAAYGHERFVLCLGYLGGLVREFFTRGTVRGRPAASGPPVEPSWQVTFADTGETTGTSGRVHRIREEVERFERFFLTYGDGLSSVPIDSLLDFHLAKGRLATLTAVRPPTTFGVLREEDGIVTAFAEKPRLEVLVNGGFFVMERGVFEYVRPEGALEEEPLKALAAAGELAAYRHDGFWQCMDDQKQLEMLNAMWERGDRPWAIWEKR
ncbi:MAG: sugar phosphate nucleotidyltransferase [Planctomycetota bacterium]